MAFSNFWPGNRGRHGQSPRDHRDARRTEGNDSYGSNPERYGAGNYDTFADNYQDRDFDFGGAETLHRDRGRDYDLRSSGRYDSEHGGPHTHWTDPSQERFDQQREPRQQFRGRGPKGYKRSDERIREDVCECLTDDHEVDASDIEVTVKDCEVTLSGSVASRDQKRRAERILEGISGVADIHNRLRVGGEGSSNPPPDDASSRH